MSSSTEGELIILSTNSDEEPTENASNSDHEQTSITDTRPEDTKTSSNESPVNSLTEELKTSHLHSNVTSSDRPLSQMSSKEKPNAMNRKSSNRYLELQDDNPLEETKLSSVSKEQMGTKTNIGRKLESIWASVELPKPLTKKEVIARYKNYCAGIIQKVFRQYQAKKHHKIFIRHRELRRALLIGWKTRRVFTCRKLIPYKKRATKIIKALELDVASTKTKCELILLKRKYVEDLISIIHILYLAGTWTGYAGARFVLERDTRVEHDNPLEQSQLLESLYKKESEKLGNEITNMPCITIGIKNRKENKVVKKNEANVLADAEDAKRQPQCLNYDDVPLPVVKPNDSPEESKAVPKTVVHRDYKKKDTKKQKWLPEMETFDAVRSRWEQTAARVYCYKKKTQERTKVIKPGIQKKD